VGFYRPDIPHNQTGFEQFFPNEKAENERFTNIAKNRVSTRYFPSFKVAEMLGLSGHALSKITSSFMVVTSDGQKHNLGLSLKFEAKGLKVIGYSRKMDRYWEFSERAVELMREYKVRVFGVYGTSC
jgi:5'-3' exoribonuclease 1